MKTKGYVSAGLLLMATGFTLSSCETEESKEKTEELGAQAAIEFCDCFQKNSKNKCLEEMKSNYASSVYMSDDFIDAFNKQSECGITLEKTYTYSKVDPTEMRIVERK